MTLQLIAKSVVLYTIMFAQNIGLFVKLIYFILIKNILFIQNQTRNGKSSSIRMAYICIKRDLFEYWEKVFTL